MRLIMHRQEDGSYVSDPAPKDGAVECVVVDEDERVIFTSYKSLNVGDVVIGAYSSMDRAVVF